MGNGGRTFYRPRVSKENAETAPAPPVGWRGEGINKRGRGERGRGWGWRVNRGRGGEWRGRGSWNMPLRLDKKYRWKKLK